MFDMRTLTVTSVGETEEQNLEVTISPADVRLVVVYKGSPITLQGREFKKTVVIFADGFEYQVQLSDFDIDVLQTTIGGFGMPMD
jgi:hypothetical protein